MNPFSYMAIFAKTVMIELLSTIKGGSHRAEKSCKVRMMMKAAKLGHGWEESEGQEQAGSRLGAGQGQCKSREEARVG